MHVAARGPLRAAGAHSRLLSSGGCVCRCARQTFKLEQLQSGLPLRAAGGRGPAPGTPARGYAPSNPKGSANGAPRPLSCPAAGMRVAARGPLRAAGVLAGPAGFSVGCRYARRALILDCCRAGDVCAAARGRLSSWSSYSPGCRCARRAVQDSAWCGRLSSWASFRVGCRCARRAVQDSAWCGRLSSWASFRVGCRCARQAAGGQPPAPPRGASPLRTPKGARTVRHARCHAQLLECTSRLGCRRQLVRKLTRRYSL